ncbi:universal stress protein [Tianweitania sediminis]|uniref:Universal stress protein n=1 Tax=Tianweitania sediminis TaxID=1502156 RepID=A0A8J7UKU9_9HYPH|nr:universal stress protein [Tianweitania sediminis]MBP0438712.1 universal stress protein [Tianweitania sediminis]
MTRILALIDGSSYAGSVCDHVVWIAGRTAVSIDLLHVIGRRDLSSEPVDLSGNIGLGARTALLQELADLDAQKAKVAQKRGRLLLDDAKTRLEAAGVQQVETRLRNGDLLETVQDLQPQADMIVIGKRGEGSDFAREHLGSNLERVVRSTQMPVVIVSRAFKPIQRVMIAFDGEPTAFAAVERVSRSEILRGVELKLLMVGESTDANQNKLTAAASTLKAAGIESAVALLPGEAETVIPQVLEREGHDLLVMGAYRHSRLRSLFLGSTTREVIQTCRVPVVVFR